MLRRSSQGHNFYFDQHSSLQKNQKYWQIRFLMPAVTMTFEDCHTNPILHFPVKFVIRVDYDRTEKYILLTSSSSAHASSKTHVIIIIIVIETCKIEHDIVIFIFTHTINVCVWMCVCCLCVFLFVYLYIQTCFPMYTIVYTSVCYLLGIRIIIILLLLSLYRPLI